MLFNLVFALASGHLAENPVMVDGQLCHPTRLMVKVSTQANTVEDSVLGTVIGRFPEIGWETIQVPVGTLHESKAMLVKTPGVLDVQYDRVAQPAYTPNDPLWGNEWHLRTLKLDLAWDTSKGSASTIVGLIDTGCNVNHEDLNANIWVNPGEIPGNGIDDDHNGYVDDVNGFDFAYNDGDPNDVLGHGSACAGLIGAVQDNNIGISGACPKVRIMVLKACNDSGYLYDSYLIPAYIYGANNGARVFSMSYFSDRVSKPEKDAMDYAVSKNVLPVAAAGNNYSTLPFYPGAYENVLSVAATDGNNNKSGFSNFGSWVDVAAPGQGLQTTSASGGYQGFAGTSGACPQVAGTAALLIGAKPSASAATIWNALEDTATTLTQSPFGEFSNYGLVNAQAALQAVLGTPAPQKPIVVRFAANLGKGAIQFGSGFSTILRARIYGRGFLGTSALSIKVGGRTCPIYGRSRETVDFGLTIRSSGNLEVFDGTTKIASIPVPLVPGVCNPLSEAANESNSLSGNFYSTIADDGQTMDSPDNGQGSILLEGTFRNVEVRPVKDVSMTRKYTLAGGSEVLQLYDWSSNSYPYGNWVTVATSTPGTANSKVTARITDIARYIDVCGSVYVRILATGVTSGDTLKVDSLLLKDGN